MQNLGRPRTSSIPAAESVTGGGLLLVATRLDFDICADDDDTVDDDAPPTPPGSDSPSL